MRLLVTGGAGFIGSTLVRHLLDRRSGVSIVNLDALTYAGSLDNLTGVMHHRDHRFVHGDVCDVELVRGAMEGVDAVVNLAAESHVDRSIREPAPFVRSNVTGTQVLLDVAREARVERFLQVSTDEVYGHLTWADPDGDDPGDSFLESSPLRPRSPYAASKAAADLLVEASRHTYGMDTVIVRACNTYGPRQHPEKLIPMVITRAAAGENVPLYGDGLHVRDWLHVDDHCRGIVAALEKGEPGGIYNLGRGAPRTNLQLVEDLLDLMDAPRSLITFVEDRPGHDRRYAVDWLRAFRDLEWEPSVELDEGLLRTVHWYQEQSE